MSRHVQRDSAPYNSYMRQLVDVEGHAAHISHNEVSRVVAFVQDSMRDNLLSMLVCPVLVTVTSKEPPIYDTTSHDGYAVIDIGVLV